MRKIGFIIVKCYEIDKVKVEFNFKQLLVSKPLFFKATLSSKKLLKIIAKGKGQLVK